MTIRDARQGDAIQVADGSDLPAKAIVNYVTREALTVTINGDQQYTTLHRNGRTWPLWERPEVKVR